MVSPGGSLHLLEQSLCLLRCPGRNLGDRELALSVLCSHRPLDVTVETYYPFFTKQLVHAHANHCSLELGSVESQCVFVLAEWLKW